MITKKTVFVLGAGASMPYGYPSGYELYQNLVNLRRVKNDSRDYFISEALELGSKIDLSSFCESLFKSGKQSIDSFLENRDYYMRLGKALIAHEIYMKEKPHKLFSFSHQKEDVDDDGLIVDREIENKWYRLFWKVLTSCPEGEISSFSDVIEKNNLNIVTFNYDLSLEAFLTNAIMNSYDVQEKEIGKFFNKIKIIHVYGSVELYPYGTMMQLFHEDPNSYIRALNISLDRINLIRSGDGLTNEMEIANELLSDADQICFLGFGFDLTNLNRLGFVGDERYKGKVIMGTTKGIGFPVWKKVGDLFRINPENRKYQLLNGSISDFFFDVFNPDYLDPHSAIAVRTHPLYKDQFEN